MPSALSIASGVALSIPFAATGSGSTFGEAFAPLLLAAAFLLLFSLPFLPAIREVYAPRDEYPLPINLTYSKNPRFLGESAWKIVAEALGERWQSDGLQVVQMSKEETIEVSPTRSIARGSEIANVIYVHGDLTLEREVVCDKDVFVTGGASIAPSCTLRVLCCKGSLSIGARSRVARWVDVGGDVEVGDEVALGITAAAGRVKLGRDVEFKRLFGAPIVTSEASDRELSPPRKPGPPRIPERLRTIEDLVGLHRDSLAIERGRTVNETVVVKKNLTLEERAMLLGSARVYGKTMIGARAVVTGDLFCEGPIDIGEGAEIHGNIFSQDIVRVGRGVRIGGKNRPKSVIAKKEIHLGRDVLVHGYVLTDGRGIAK